MPPPPAAAVPFRDRPVLEHIVEQHAEEAAFLWTLRDAATDAPHYKRHHLARLDERVEAHVDGLRVAGEAGWRIALEQLGRRCEKGELFAAGVLALESGDMRRIEPLVARAEAEPEARRGFVGAIAWCRPELLASTVRVWQLSHDGFNRYLALCSCSVHRADPGPRFAARLGDAELRVRARALRLAGEIGRAGLRDLCVAHLDDVDGDAAIWAAWSAVLLGDRGPALTVLEELAPRKYIVGAIALELAVRAMGVERGFRFVRAVDAGAGLRRTAIVSLGCLGDPAAVPWLIDRMQETDYARVAGESFSTISGADLQDDNLERDLGPGEARPVPGADSGDDVAASHLDERLPWPDPASVRTWWSTKARRFAPGMRYLAGRAIDSASCRAVWRDAYQRRRRAAAYELALLRPEGGLPNWRSRV